MLIIVTKFYTFIEFILNRVITFPFYLYVYFWLVDCFVYFIIYQNVGILDVKMLEFSNIFIVYLVTNLIFFNTLKSPVNFVYILFNVTEKFGALFRFS